MRPSPDFEHHGVVAHARMPKPVSWRDLVRRLRALGFSGPFWGTKHPFMVRGTLTLHIPADHGRDIGMPLLAEVLRQAGIRRDEWDQMK